jgi:Protein of unknown function (DUF3224)
MSTSARGSFEIQRRAQSTQELGSGASFGRITFDKQFQGDLTGTSVVEMLSVGTEVKGSAAYVALEHVTGTLAGRSGTFALQHSGTMRRGAAQLALSVVPDSGSAELKGLTGTLKIDIVDGKHFYVFDYAFED